MSFDVLYEPSVEELVNSYFKLRFRESNPAGYGRVSNILDNYFGDGYAGESVYNDALKSAFGTNLSLSEKLKLKKITDHPKVNTNLISTWPSKISTVYSEMFRAKPMSWKNIVAVLEVTITILSRALTCQQVGHVTKTINALVNSMKEREVTTDGTFKNWIEESEALLTLIMLASDERPHPGTSVPSPFNPTCLTPDETPSQPVIGYPQLYATALAKEQPFTTPLNLRKRSCTSSEISQPQNQKRRMVSDMYFQVPSLQMVSASTASETRDCSSFTPSKNNFDISTASNVPQASQILIQSWPKSQIFERQSENSNRFRINRCGPINCGRWKCGIPLCNFEAMRPANILVHLKENHKEFLNKNECYNCGTTTTKTSQPSALCNKCGWVKCMHPDCDFQTNFVSSMTFHIKKHKMK